MSEKYLIFGATGSIGSSLAKQLKNSGNDIHLIARNESEVSSIAEKLGCSFTVADVLEEGFIEKVKAEYLYRCWLVMCLWCVAMGCFPRSVNFWRCV